MQIKTLFFGSPEFGLTILKSLLSLEYIEMVGVVTQPDKEFGRKKILKATKVKEYVSKEYPEIKIFCPTKLKEDAQSILDETKPELIIVASYGKILPEIIINYPKYRCLNIHGSLLPLLRGAIPVQMAILKGFETTGVSVQIMKMEMDQGDIIFTRSIPIENTDTSGILMNKLADIGSEIIQKDLIQYIEGKTQALAQDNSKATYCYLTELSYEKAQIDWNQSIVQVSRKIRAFNPNPIAYSNGLVIKLMDKFECNIQISGKVKIIDSSAAEKINLSEIPENINLQSGDGIVQNQKLYIKTIDDFICILKLQLEGKNVVSSAEYINGLKNKI
ncbi:MAG: methionyl-tRNA formyltransferase [bacterium]